MRSGDEIPLDNPKVLIPEKADETVSGRASVKGNKFPDPLRRRYNRLVSILRTSSDVLKIAQCPRSVVDDYAQLLEYLASIEDSQIQKILTPSASPKFGPTVGISDDAIRKMSLEDIENITRSQTTSRATLEQVAVIRFFTTRSELSTARNRDALVEKLLGMVESERTRLTIHKLASGSQ